MTTSSLIDHIVTNAPDSGVIHTGISDHSLVFAIRKTSVIDKQENILEIRNMKNFNEEKFIEDLLNNPGNIYISLQKIQMPCGKFGKNISRCPIQTFTTSAQKDKINKGSLDYK